jgi:hypothetical protein
MLKSMSRPTWPMSFGFASTTVDSKLAFAIVFGCSDNQQTRVHELLEDADPMILHPLVMLSICAELHLDRLEELVKMKARDSESLKTVLMDGDISRQHLEELRKHRYESAIAQQEITMTQREFSEVLPLRLCEPDHHQPNGANSSTQDNISPLRYANTMHIKGNPDVARTFQKRFVEVLDRFEYLAMKCRLGVDQMSFAVHLVCIHANKIHTLLIIHRFKVSWREILQRTVQAIPFAVEDSLLWLGCCTYQLQL